MNTARAWMGLVPALLMAVAVQAQTPAGSTADMRQQVQQARKALGSQESRVKALKAQIHELKARNASEQAQVSLRDREIARLKAELARRQHASGHAPAGAASAPHEH